MSDASPSHPPHPGSPIRARLPHTRADFHAAQGVLMVVRPPPPAPLPVKGQPALVAGNPEEGVEILIAVWDDGSVTALNGHVDLGTGIRTALAQVVAEELDVPLKCVHMVLGNTATKVQTRVIEAKRKMELALGGLYSEEAIAAGVDHHKGDLIFASLPYKIMAPLQVPVYDEMKRRDADLYSRLEKAGFMLDFGVDGSGLFMKYLRRGSGYYIDVGASELVANGSIKLKSRTTIERINPKSVTLTDGTELPCDVLVYATGYGSMNQWLAGLISPAVADRLGKVWGLGSDTPKDPGPWEGELRNMWKPTQVPHLWVHGGNLHQSRHYSQFLSLQLKARLAGIPTPVYGLAPVHHTR